MSAKAGVLGNCETHPKRRAEILLRHGHKKVACCAECMRKVLTERRGENECCGVAIFNPK